MTLHQVPDTKAQGQHAPPWGQTAASPVHTAPTGLLLARPTSHLVLMGGGQCSAGAEPTPSYSAPARGQRGCPCVGAKPQRLLKIPLTFLTFLSSRKHALSTIREEEQGGCSRSCDHGPRGRRATAPGRDTPRPPATDHRGHQQPGPSPSASSLLQCKHLSHKRRLPKD